MPGRKTFSPQEIGDAKAATTQQIAAFRELSAEGPVSTDFEPLYFNNMALALDRFFVHRVRVVSDGDTTPLDELELISASVRDHGSVFTESSAISYQPEKSVLGLRAGDDIRLTADSFEKLADAVFEELETTYSEK